MDNSGNHPIISEREAFPTPASAGDALPYARFDLPEADTRPVPQLQALLDDPEIAGYLRDSRPAQPGRTPALRAILGCVVAALAVAAVFLLVPGNMFRTYAPPPPRDTPKPQPYTHIASLPILFRDAVRDINDDIQDGNRWQTAFDKLRGFLADADASQARPTGDVLDWARQEMLVILASREIPPGHYPESYPDDIAARLEADRDPDSPLPFRAGAAYARILAGRAMPKDEAEAAARREELATLLESLRAAHPALLDNNRELLAIEAENHIGQFPAEYIQGDQYLDYHWRRAAHAIIRLYELYGKRDPGVRQIDRRRWQAVHRYFDLTLFTLDPRRLGRLKSARLDGVDYTRDDIRRELEHL